MSQKFTILLIVFYLSIFRISDAKSQACNGLTTLTADNGSISDGSGSNNYQAYSNCQWLIQPSGSSSVTLTFTEFNTESCCDFVEVYDGTSSSGILLGSFSGTNLPPQLTTNSGSLFVQFYSDGTSQKSGWSAFYSSCLPTVIPTISYSGSTQFCMGDSIILLSSKGSSYLWSNGETSRKIVVKKSGDYSVFVTDSTSCISTSASVNVNVLTIATNIAISGNSSICKGDSVKLSVPLNSGNQYQWMINSGNIQGGNSSEFYADSSGDYSVFINNGSCTATSSTVKILVYDIPATPLITAGGPTTFCAGQSVTLTSSPANNYLWSNGATTQSIVVVKTGKYTVKISDGNCSSTSSAINVLNGGPSIFVNAKPQSICSGGSTQLSASSNFIFSENFDPLNSVNWSSISSGNSNLNCGSVSGNALFFDGNGNRNATTKSLDLSSGGTIDFYLKIGSNSPFSCEYADFGEDIVLEYSTNGGSSWTNIDTYYTGTVYTNFTLVSVTIPPAAKTTTTSLRWSQIYHSGQSFDNWALDDINISTFSSGKGLSYSWAPSTGLSSTTISNPIATITSSTTYQVSVTDSVSGCFGTALIVVNVFNPATSSITPSGPITSCQNNPVVLTASVGDTYLWSNGATTQSITVDSSGTYTVEIAHTGGCKSVSNAVDVSITPSPNVSISANGQTTICKGDSVLLSATAPTGYTYQWNNNGMTIPGATSSSYYASTSGSYDVTISNASFCTINSNSIYVSVSNSNGNITPYGNTTFCLGDSVELYFSGSGQTYQWLLNDTVIPGANSYYLYANKTGNYNIQVTDYNGCTSKFTAVFVTVLSTPNTPVITASGPTSFCQGENVTLTSSQAGNYLWSNGESTQSITVTKSGLYYVITGSPGSTCTAKSNSIQILNSSPQILITSSQDTICSGGSIQLDIIENNTINENFDPTDNTNWIDIQSGVTSNGCGSKSGNALYFDGNGNRLLETIDINVSAGGKVTFYLKIGNGNFPCEMADSGEDIILQYSINSGVTWINIKTYYTGSAYSSFKFVSENIPVAAQTKSTRFRWSQPYHSGSGFDNWALDDISIQGVAGAGNYTYSWSPAIGLSDETIKNPISILNSTTTYTVTVTDTSNSCTATASILLTATNGSANIHAAGPTTFCMGGKVTLTADPGTAYLWSNGETTRSVTITLGGTYIVEITNPYGCSGTFTSAPVTVTTTSSATAVITANGPTEFCQGGSVKLTANAGSSYQWSNGQSSQSILVNQSGSYYVDITDAGGCSGNATSNTIHVIVNPIPNAPIISQNGNVLTSSQTYGNQWYFNNQVIVGAKSQNYNAIQNGIYTVEFTDTNACSVMSLPYTVATGIDEYTQMANSFIISPNPFISELNISYVLNKKTYVTLELYNLVGKKIKTIVENSQVQGEHHFKLRDISSGAYLLILSTPEGRFIKKVIRLD